MKSLLKRIFEGDDSGIGWEPLEYEFVRDVYGLSDEDKKIRRNKLLAYYQAILKRSKSLHVAYGKTREWAKKIFAVKYGSQA